MADLGSSGRVRKGGRAHPLASEGASYIEGVVDSSDAAHHHMVELLDPIGGEARSEVVTREIEVDAAREVGEAGQHEPVEAVLGDVEVAQRGEEADVWGLSRRGDNRAGMHLKTRVGLALRMGVVAWMGGHHAR
jgi:hypothetical protein